jgi:hypothetical protein
MTIDSTDSYHSQAAWQSRSAGTRGTRRDSASCRPALGEIEKESRYGMRSLRMSAATAPLTLFMRLLRL